MKIVASTAEILCARVTMYCGKFTEKTTVIYSTDVSRNSPVETEKKQAKCQGDFFNQLFNRQHLKETIQLNVLKPSGNFTHHQLSN
jgi:hypothetical protein